MALSLIACGQQAETPDTTPAPQEQTPTVEPEPEPVAAISDPIPYDEYERGIWYGFLPDELLDADPDATVVTWKQMCYMLGKFIERYQPESLPAWEEQVDAATDEPMKRDGGMIALLFAARTVNMDYHNHAQAYMSEFDGYECSWDYPVFSWDEPYQLLNLDGQPPTAMFNAFSYSFVYRISLVSGAPLIEDIDGEHHLNYDFPLRDALISVVRLYESDEQHVSYDVACALLERVKQTPEGQAIVAAAEERKQAILNSETKIVKSDTFIQGETYTGTAYYVSNSGDDANDGLSPETAWATIDRLASAQFEFGDAIFFERGGLWREVEMPENMRNTAGLTLSAYGTGEKPRLYGSPENGAGAEKWELYYEGEDGEKIWKFHREMMETMVVAMNDGETYAQRVIPYWNGTEFVLPTDFVTPYEVENGLRDMEFFTDLHYAAKPFMANRIFYAGYENGYYTYIKGPFYLRCDAGNPGEVYDSIEFATANASYDTTPSAPMGIPEHTTFDNLNLSYCLQPCGGSEYTYTQYCELGWSGGKVNYFESNDPYLMSQHHQAYGLSDDDSTPMIDLYFQDGGALNAGKRYQISLNNYVHHQFQEGVTLEVMANQHVPFGDILHKGNLLEYCGMGMVLTNWNASDAESNLLRNVHFEDNMVLYSGFDSFLNHVQTKERDYFVHNIAIRNSGNFAFTDGERLNAHDGTVSINNNVFAFCATQLFKLGSYTEKYSHIFDGNTYAQIPGMPWLYKADYVRMGDPNPPFYFYADPDVAIHDWVQDEHATIIRFDQ